MSSTELGVGDPLELLAVHEIERGRYTGVCIDGAIGRVFGGHALAQAVRAASICVGDRRPVNAVHVSFVRPAVPSEPLLYFTDVVKSGRSLDVVSVRAEQLGAVTLVGFVTTHETETSVEFADPAPPAPDPGGIPASDYLPQGTSPGVRAPFELRYLPPFPTGVAREDVWIRSRARVGSERQADHAALLSYAIDFLVTRSAYPGLPEDLVLRGASLDHAMWFHRPFRIDDWLLVSSSCSVFAGSRSLATSRIFDMNGRLVATATQEALIRPTDSSG